MAAVIEIKNLVKDYRLGEVPVHVLKNISFEIEQGDFVSIMGPSGSGKSTLMNILGCLDKPTSGAYTLDGISVGNLNRDQLAEIRNKKIGFVFQQFNLLARTSAAENVELPLMYTDTPARERHERARKALLVVGLDAREEFQPSQLSGGQQQRVAIARSLVNDPSIILADEPTGALDSTTGVEIMAIFQRLNREEGITMIVVTHDPDIAAYSNRTIHFKDGMLQLDERLAQRQSVEGLGAASRRAAQGGSFVINKIVAGIRIALRALKVNRMRSTLTMLGIIIGVAAVIAMVGVGSGATARIEQQIQSIGSNLIIVLPGSISSSGVRLGSGAVATLTQDDAKAIAAECPSVALAAPTVRGGVQVVYGNNNWATNVQGVTPDYMTIRDYTMLSGQFFTTQDVDAAAKTAVLGETVARNLFGDSDPTGQAVIIKNVPFTVAGVLTPKGQSPTGQDQDDVILLPISTATQKVLGVNKANARAVGALMVQAISPEAMDQAIQEMEALLRERHKILPGLDDDFTIRNLTEVFQAQETSAQVMSILLGAIASVSLIVGGIGIMNIAADYFQIRGLDASRQLLDATVKSYEQNVQLTQDRYDGGVASMGDVALAQTQLETARAQLADLGVQRAQFEHALAVLTGRPPSDLSIPAAPNQSPPPASLIGIPSTLLERRPDVAVAERQVAAANEQIGIAKAAYYPSLTFSAGGGFQSAAVLDLLTWPTRFWSMGLQLTEVIFEAGKRRAQVKLTEAAYDATVANYRQTVLTAFQQVEDSLAQLRILSEEAEIIARAVKAAQQSLEISTIQYRSGTANYLQVITAQTSALQNQRSAVDILTRRLVASVSLIQALGGGWDASQLPSSHDLLR